MNKNILFFLVLLMVLGGIFSNSFNNIAPSADQLSYSEFIGRVNDGSVRSVKIDGYTISGHFENGDRFTTTRPAAQDSRLIDDLLNNNVEIEGEEPQGPGVFRQLLVAAFPVLLLLGVLYFAMRNLQNLGGSRGNPITFGKSRAKELNREEIKTRFKDVAGVEEAKEEVAELVEFLKDPSRFHRMGARIPRGVLMCGLPGTGKTLLARAIAGEAGVPFFTISGSDFVEMFVGVGASRVRDMFNQAKKSAPCIVFIDEIDAVGRHRGAGLGGGHDEREQTLNQLLVEMDGFEKKDGTIVIAATNRPDVLDPALLRPGRFDRQVIMPLPDIKGREHIMLVHMNNVPYEDEKDAAIIARGTPGFSGADLANLVNEAALIAAKNKKKKVGILELEKAKDKVMMGSERRSMVMSDKDREITAYHEAGHAIVGLSVPGHDPVYKVTIIPRGQALGLTMFLPEEDKYSQSKQVLKSQLCSLFGGRVAEELVFGKEFVTTGASNDIERATNIARAMVTKWGLSEKLGPRKYDENGSEPFLGRQFASSNSKTPTSEEITNLIDKEISILLTEAYDTSRNILKKNMSKLKVMSKSLIDYETIGEKQIKEIMAGKKPSVPDEWQEINDRKKEAEKQGKKMRSKSAGKDKTIRSKDRGAGSGSEEAINNPSVARSKEDEESHP